MKRWEKIFTDADRILMKKIGFGEKQDFGSHPALLIIDINKRNMGSHQQPTLPVPDSYKGNCGEAGWKALRSIHKLLKGCRANGTPVIFTTGDAVARQFCGSSTKTKRARRTLDLQAEDIPEPISPQPSELVIAKPKASAFFGTCLLPCLRSMGIDSILITGTSTSGCVRASAVDAFSHGFRCFVVEECTFDRFELSHLVSLFDMNAKYADVISLKEALQHITQVSRKKDEGEAPSQAKP